VYDTLLDKIAERKRKYGEGLQPPCSPEDLKSLQRSAKSELDCDIIDECARFLKRANGLDWNGIVVYASKRTPIVGYTDRFIEGFVEANLNFRGFEPMKDYLIFADDGVVLFTLHAATNKYDVITRVGLSILKSYGSFDELLTDAFSGHM
jgi:hypothetical protein